MTRSEILDQFRQFDTQTLEKLITYGSLLLIPEADLLVNVTMKDMVRKAVILAAEYFPEWTDHSKADFGQFLVELSAMQSEKNFWYINAAASESYLRNMSVYANAFVRAIEMGYDPILQQSARAPFTLTIAPGKALTVPVGGLVVALANGLQFTNTAPLVIDESAQDTVATYTLAEGTYGTNTSAFNGHETTIGKSGIDIDSITLEINDTPWQRARVFGQSGPQSKHFALLPEASADATAYFGDDGYGLRPSVGDTLLFTYRACSGDAGNAPILSATINQFPSGRLVRSVVMVDEAKNGRTQESLESIKNTAPLYSRFKKAAFNETATENFLLAQYDVKKAKAAIVSKSVFFYAVSNDPLTDETELLDTLDDLLKPYLMYGYEAVPTLTNYVKLSDVTIELYALKNTNLPALVQKATEIVLDYTDPRVGANYGEDFSLTDLATTLVARLAGLQNVRFISVNGKTPADVSVSSTRILQKIAPEALNITAYVKS